MSSGFHSKRGARSRGSALLLAVVIVAILSVIVVAVIQLSSSEVEAVVSKRRHDQSISCADAARQMLQSQFRASGVTPTDLTLDRVVGDQRLATGHFDNIGVTGAVVEAEGSSSQAEFGATDMGNLIVASTLGGQLYRMSVVCSSTTDPSRQAEVEFVVRFGL